MGNPLYEALFGRYKGQTTPFIQLPDNTVTTHTEFLELAAQYAHVFSDLGLRPGDRVAVQIEKSIQSIAIYAACTQGGLVFLPLNTAYTAKEISYFVNDSKASMLLCDSKRAEALGAIAITAGAILETMDADGKGIFI